MNKTIRAIFYFYVTIGVAGCGTFATKKGCESADLFNIGYKYARIGQPDSFDRYAKICEKKGVTLNKAKYREGRTAGLKELCVYKWGYDLALSGHKYHGVCPDDKEKDFLKGYNAGLEVAQALKAINLATKAGQQDLSNLPSQPNPMNPMNLPGLPGHNPLYPPRLSPHKQVK